MASDRPTATFMITCKIEGDDADIESTIEAIEAELESVPDDLAGSTDGDIDEWTVALTG